MEQTIAIQSGHAELTASFHLPTSHQEGDTHPLVIICHGFVGSRIGVNRLFVKAARLFAAQGFAVLRFDYEGCGESTGEYGSYGMERFIAQTQDVIDFAATMPQVDHEQIFLLGHSLGGAVAALTASRDTRIQKLALWAAVGHPFHDIVAIVGHDRYEASLATAFIDYEGFALTKTFFNSLKEYHPLERIQEFAGDVFIAHGTHDEVIPVDYCSLYQHALKRGKSANCQKELIVGGDHTFSSLDGSNQLFTSTLHWLKKQTRAQRIWNHEAI